MISLPSPTFHINAFQVCLTTSEAWLPAASSVPHSYKAVTLTSTSSKRLVETNSLSCTRLRHRLIATFTLLNRYNSMCLLMSTHDCPVSHTQSLSTSVEVLLSEDGGQHISISDAFIKGNCFLHPSLQFVAVF